MIQKFGEMRYGQWFKECRADNPRIFIKIQNVLPSGIPVVYDGFVAKDYMCGGELQKAGRRTNSFHFNAIDIDGIPGCCPDWVSYELIDSPFPQNHPNHTQGKNARLPRQDFGEPGDLDHGNLIAVKNVIAPLKDVVKEVASSHSKGKTLKVSKQLKSKPKSKEQIKKKGKS